MRHGQRGGRFTRRRDALALLARARPAALDADQATQRRWPSPEDLIAGTGQNGDGSYQSAGITSPAEPDRVSGWRWTRLGQGKLIGALSSGALTAAVVAVAVIVGTMVLGSRHSPPPRLSHPTIGQSSSAKPAGGGTPVGAFRTLPLLGDWHGHLAVAFGDGVVYLIGHASSQDARGSVMARLPPGLRPAAKIDLVISLGKAGDGSIMIMPDGSIVPVSPYGDFSLVSLDGLSFPLGSG